MVLGKIEHAIARIFQKTAQKPPEWRGLPFRNPNPVVVYGGFELLHLSIDPSFHPDNSGTGQDREFY